MGFFDREVIRPEVYQPYGAYEDVQGQLDKTYSDAQNRASQKINQMYANVGMNPRGAAATSAKARSTTDIENQRAQQGYDSYYQWLRGKQLVTPQTQPSGASSLASPFVSGIGQAAGPAIVTAATKGLGNAYDWMSSGGGAWGTPTPDWGGASYGGYGGAGGAWGEPGNMGGWETPVPDFSSAYQDVPWEYANNIPDFSDAYSEIGGWF